MDFGFVVTSLASRCFDFLNLIFGGYSAPVGIEDIRDFAAAIGGGKATIARFLSLQAHDLFAFTIEYYDGDSKAEMLEVLTYSEEVSRKVVVKQEVVNFLFDLCCGFVGVVHEPGTITHFGVEQLTSGKCFIRLNEFDDVIRHVVVTTPRHIFHLVVNADWCGVFFLFEYFVCLGSECCQAA